MKKIIKLLLFVLLSNTVFSIEVPKNLTHKNAEAFMENKGQILDQNGIPNAAVKYLLNGNGLNVQIRNTGFSYDTYTLEKRLKAINEISKNSTIHQTKADSFDYLYKYHRVDIEFVNASKQPKVEANQASTDFVNYYNVPTSPEGVLNVHSYKSVLVKDVYPGIDIEYLIDAEKGFKYNFIVHPGADYQLIQMKYLGAPSKLVQNKIELNVDAGKLEEDIPLSWMEEDKNTPVNVEYRQIEKGVFGFTTITKISSNSTLIIDPIPSRLWGTYYGGTITSRGESCDIDASGNVYLSVRTNSSGSIATSGAFQISLAGSYDFGLAKFDALGIRQWGTYYGGAGDEFGSRCVADINGNIYLVGQTTSTNNISTTGSHQILPGGLNDLFLVKFNTNGTRIWGTYYAGLGTDQRPNIAADPSGNIIISGETNSTTNISTIGSFQASYAGGNFDLFLAKFNSNGVRLWATYYGGANSDGLGSCAVDNSGNVFLIGTTESAGLSTVGAHQAVLSTNYDAIIIKFNSSGARQWSTYYGGTASEITTSCTVDLNGNILFLGHTESLNAIASIGASQTILGGLADVFLVKLNTLGVRQWGTYYGGTQFEESFCVKSDPIGNVYISGITESTTNISTIDAYQTTYMGGRDGFFSRFNSAGIRQYGSYYGGVNDEGAMVCSIKSNGTIYLAGETYSPINISTLGSHQPSLGGIQNAFLVKMFDCASIGTIGAISPIGTANTCSGLSKSFAVAAVSNAIGYNWAVPAGWVIQSGQGLTIVTVIPNSTGAVTVKGYNGCGDSTTAASLAVTVITNPTPSAITGSATPCYGVASTYSVTLVAGNTYQWVLPISWGGSPSSNSILVNALTTPATGGDSIFVRAINTTTSCPSAYVKKRVDASRAPISPAVVLGPNPACKTVATVFSVDSLPFANTYTWTFPTGWTIGTPITNRQITVTPSATAVAGNVTVRGTNTVCGAGPILTQAFLAPASIPSTPSVITGSIGPCSGSTLTYSVTNVTGINYRWVLPTDWTINSGQNTNSISVTVGSTSGSISVFPSNSTSTSCEGIPRTLAVNVVATPAAPSQITGATQVCINSSYSFTTPPVPNAINYTWTLPTGFTQISGTSTNTIGVNTGASLATSLVLSVKANNGSCSSPNFAYTIAGSSIVPTQPGTIAGNVTMCANSNQSYSIASVTNANSYTWSIPVGWTFNGNSTGNSINVVAGSSTGTISVLANNGACASTARTLSITTVTPAPQQPGSIGYSGAICGGKQIALTIAAVSGATSYIWTVPAGWTGTSTTTTINVTPNNNSDTLLVVASNGSCNSVPRKQGFIVNQTPAQPAPITGNNLVCINTSYPFYIPRISTASSYTWAVPTGWVILSGGSDTFINARPNSIAISGDITVIANNNGCGSVARNFATSVNGNLPPTPGAIAGSSIVCDGVVNDFSISSVTNALNYTWTIPTAWTFTSGQNTTSIKVVPNNTNGQITVKAINGACLSAERVLAISTVVPPPAQPVISGNANPCINANATFTVAAVPGAISYLWTSPVGWTISAPTGQGTSILIAGQTGVINVSANNGYCKGIAAALTIDASQLPNITSWEGEQYVKSFTIRKYKVSVLSGTSYVWTVPSGWTIMSGSTQNEISVLVGQNSGVITVRGANGCGTGAIYSKNVYTGVAAGMDKELLLSNIKIFPQPANDQFTLSFMPLANLDEVQLRITDMLGKTISVNSIGSIASGQTKEINFTSTEMIAGIYLLSIESKQTTKTYKISINH